MLSENGRVWHRCNGSEGCMCAYDDTCTGVFAQRLVRLPVCVDVLLRPRHTLRVLRVRRLLSKDGK